MTLINFCFHTQNLGKGNCYAYMLDRDEAEAPNQEKSNGKEIEENERIYHIYYFRQLVDTKVSIYGASF